MRKIFPLLLFASLALGQEILDFRVTLALEADALLTVTEAITVHFALPRHGIVREIPVSYRLPTGERYDLRVKVEEVLAASHPVHYEVHREGPELIIKIGDPSVLARGTVPYLIRYRVARAFLPYGNEVELYWNAIGTEWAMPIRRAQLEVIVPKDIPQAAVQFLAFRGPYGATTPFPLSWEDGRLFGEVQGLPAGHGVTVAVRVPAEYIALPGVWRKVLWFLADNAYAAIPLFVLLGMTVIWWRWGRDPQVGTVAPEFTPPPGIGPAEAGVVVDDRFDPRDFVAGIISLAIKGWLKIRDLGEDFQLVPQKGDQELTPYEEALAEALLRAKKDGPKFADLRYRLYEKIPGLRARLFLGLVDKGFYRANPEAVRSFWRACGVGIMVVGAALFFVFGNFYLALTVAAAGLVVALFAPYMPSKTRKGVDALRRVLGLSEYIRRAEVDRIEFAAKEKHFEELLPYAVALGLSDLWVEKFAAVLREPPRWYEGRGPWTPTLFPARLVLLHQRAWAAATSLPRTAQRGSFRGWTGGSGFGGRGFSGGGMGGGGGRAW